MDAPTTDAAAPVAHRNLTDAVVENAREHPDHVALVRRADGARRDADDARHDADRARWRDVTCAQWHDEVVATARGLAELGVGPGDRVALISSTRYEWTLVDYATWWLGAVSVPIYVTASARRVDHILRDCRPRVTVIEADAIRDLMGEAADAAGTIIEIDGGGLEGLVSAGRASDADLEGQRREVGRDDLATIIYTSGTTGHPKGCMLTHGNLLAAITAAVGELDELFRAPDSSTVLCLPLPHVFARVVQIGAIHTRSRLAHSAGAHTLTDDLRALRPTFILGVPRIFERAFSRTSQEALIAGESRAFDRAVGAAISYSRSLDNGGPSLRVRARHRRYTGVYARIREAFGGRVSHAVSGGAPLGEPLAHFLRGAGVPVLEGYGLTETSATVTMNRPHEVRIGTVGRPLPGTRLRVTEAGELFVAGPQVFTGYWNDPDATAEVLSDGWLHTGDLGEVDDDGFVRVTGRAQEVLVTAGGKHVSPGVIENHVRRHPFVKHCLVVGDRRPYVAALMTLDHKPAVAWARDQGLPTQLDALSRHPDLIAEIQAAVDEANAQVSHAEAIRRFTVLGVDWSEKSGEVTPTKKLRRSRVLAAHHDDIEALYL